MDQAGKEAVGLEEELQLHVLTTYQLWFSSKPGAYHGLTWHDMAWHDGFCFCRKCWRLLGQ